jgi:ketosteroid isomerase-like protein
MDDLDLQELMDKQSITERLLDYARGVDRIDRELICSVFQEDAHLDYGAMFVGTGEEFADFIGVVHPAMEAHSHHLGNIYITVDGDRAGSETYVLARLRSRGPDGTLNDTVSSGRYVDQWVRQGGEWRIAHRNYLHGMDSTRGAGAPGYPATGDRSVSDPSYAVLALTSTEGA